MLPPLRNRETAQLQDPEIEDKETRPPTRYNEGTLIEAMQNAWRFIDDEISSGARHARADPPGGTEAGYNKRRRRSRYPSSGWRRRSRSRAPLLQRRQVFAGERCRVRLARDFELKNGSISRYGNRRFKMSSGAGAPSAGPPLQWVPTSRNSKENGLGGTRLPCQFKNCDRASIWSSCFPLGRRGIRR